MPLPPIRTAKYTPTKDVTVDWDNFRLGLNTLLRETELEENELAQADNLFLTGSGVPTKRWGSANYALMGSGNVGGFKGYYKTDGTNELLALSDSGYLVKKSNASYSILTGASWVSGYNSYMTQLNDNMYVVNGVDVFRKYNGTTISSYATLSIPSSLGASKVSGATGTFTYSWRVSAENAVGETVPSTAITLGSLPERLTDCTVRLAWTTSSPASSVIGYVIYGRDQNNELYLNRVNSSTLSFFDNETYEPAPNSSPPTTDTTGGPIAKYIIKHDNRLILGNLSGKKSRVMFSGRNTNAEKFHWSQGGGYIDIDVDGGDDITGLGVYQDKIVVFKEKSVWELSIAYETIGNWTIANPSVSAITNSHGAISGKSIASVENDLFFLSRSGVYVLGYEPNILNVLRTNEVSVKIRDFFAGLTYTDLQNACAEYVDKKYVLSFPVSKKTVIYDRERTAWMGPWITPYGIKQWGVYYDSAGAEKWLAGTDDGYVTEFNSGYGADRGTAFNTILRTRKEDFGDWSLFKTIKNLFINVRNVQGELSVSIRTEERDGNITSAKSFSITTTSTNAGWGADLWGNTQFGDSEEHGSALDVNDLVRWVLLNKTARSVQLELRTSNAGDNYELLGVILNAKPQGLGATPSSWKV